MCRLARSEYEEEVTRNKELHDAIAQERARQKYEKHYGICKEVSSVKPRLHGYILQWKTSRENASREFINLLHADRKTLFSLLTCYKNCSYWTPSKQFDKV